jgi:radical SAM protein with 4Fe4S-binding SPASM domain
MCLVTFDWEHNDAVEKFKKYREQKSASWSVVELTNSCNFNCEWCYASAGYNYRPEHMSKEKALELVKILADAGIKQITCSGGEPTLYPHLNSFIEACKDYGIITHINTNGYLLTKKLALELKKAGLSQVQTNIDSLTPSEHDRVRGKKGSFERAKKAIKNSMEAGMTVVSQTVLTRNNENEVIDIIKFVRTMGVQRIRVWDMTGEGYAKGRMKFVPTNYVESLRRIAQFAEMNRAKNVESCDPLFPLDFETRLTSSGMGCVAVRGLLIHISVKGDVFYCATHRKSLYNLFEVSKNRDIKNFHKEKVEEFVSSIKLPEKCVKCEFFDRCKGGCNTRRNFSDDNLDYFCPFGNRHD